MANTGTHGDKIFCPQRAEAPRVSLAQTGWGLSPRTVAPGRVKSQDSRERGRQGGGGGEGGGEGGCGLKATPWCPWTPRAPAPPRQAAGAVPFARRRLIRVRFTCCRRSLHFLCVPKPAEDRGESAGDSPPVALEAPRGQRFACSCAGRFRLPGTRSTWRPPPATRRGLRDFPCPQSLSLSLINRVYFLQQF